MMPIDFEGSNLTLTKPQDMTDEECMEIKAYRGKDADGFPFIATAWQPSYEDIEAIKAGRPVWLKVIGETTPPVAMFTMNEKNEIN